MPRAGFENKEGSSSHLQLVIPRQLHKEILEEQRGGTCTTGGHLGEDKTVQRLKEQLYWWTDVQNWCRKCHTCAERKIPAPHRHAVLHSIQTGYPMQLVTVDIMGLLYLSVILETNTSLLPEIISHKGGRLSLTNLGSHYCGQIALVDNMFCRYSAPEHKLHSDLWRQFEAEVLQEICRTLYTSRRPAQQHSTFRAMA